MWGEEDANLFAARKGLGVGLGVVEECVGWVEVECGELRNARRAGLCSGLRGVVRPRMKMASMIFLCGYRARFIVTGCIDRCVDQGQVQGEH